MTSLSLSCSALVNAAETGVKQVFKGCMTQLPLKLNRLTGAVWLPGPMVQAWATRTRDEGGRGSTWPLAAKNLTRLTSPAMRSSWRQRADSASGPSSTTPSASAANSFSTCPQAAHGHLQGHSTAIAQVSGHVARSLNK